MHIFALIRRYGFDQQLFTFQNLTNEALTCAHEGVIIFCDLEILPRREVNGVIQMVRRGRPRRSVGRIHSRAETITRRSRECSNCHQRGHYARTCPSRNTSQ